MSTILLAIGIGIAVIVAIFVVLLVLHAIFDKDWPWRDGDRSTGGLKERRNV